ncbi:helix-turn-helix transcriptional regulator [Chryseobacterium sp. RP-3-3]|uniref:Helix-turn-helix transcriptional regulator n=1 Tax=Chryseobacterium antibioticum TaxID=2728847 RepID=A0A7Y0ALB5_9FLAO|nr:AraC family transcriptional regulator [Chryseobacterium antibioticum]NML69472.1 helix-turn-helix transcriptional regulator [Chryseobacterium antibioticum]
MFAVIILTVAIPNIYKIEFVFSKKYILFTNTYTIITILYMIFFILYYNNKITKRKEELDLRKRKIIKYPPSSINTEEVVDSEERYEELFAEIIEYFEKKKPYQNVDFNIQDLAAQLHSNSTYISRAVNMNTKKNYKTFVNKYRIKQIKTQLSDVNYDKYNLMYIYTSAGFKHQSTFNKVFKQVESMTPSEYIQLHELKIR